MNEMGPLAKLLQDGIHPAKRESFSAGYPLAAHRTTPLRCLMAVLAFILTQSIGVAQESQSSSGPPAGAYTLTINSDLVLLSATVVDRDNALVTGLGKDDFKVYEDGVLQPIKYFSYQDIPVTAGIVVDNSGSMGPKRADVIASAMAFARSSNPQDQIFVVNFNERVSFGLPQDTPFTDQPDKLLLALSSIRATGRTALYDGMAAALEHLKEGNREKKVLILITDGGDNASKLSLARVIDMAKQSSAIVYAIGILNSQDDDPKPAVLRQFARETGGEAFFPESPGQIDSICKGIARDIRNQYTLAYVPRTARKPGSYRFIKVIASAPHRGRLSVRTRAGYTAPAATPPERAPSNDIHP
jgi:VWFA-related protein